MILSRWFPPLAVLTLLLYSSAGSTARDEVEAFRGDILQVREIDIHVFSGNESDLRKWLRAGLQGILDEIVQSCGLTDAQREKLELAGRKDISRFFEVLNTIRSEFAGRERDEVNDMDVIDRAEPLRLSINRGLFSAGSLFDKSLPKVLSEEQFTSWREVLEHRRAYRYLACIERTVMLWDSVVPFRAQQRRALIALLTDATQCPLKFGAADYAVVVAQAARIPAERFLAILDPDQWRVLEKSMRQGDELRRELQSSGVLSETEPSATE